MSEIRRIPVGKIIITGDNPRQEFNLESLKHLGESIVSHGLIQPIIVRPKEDYYELVVGERRLRAAQLLGLDEIEAKIEELDDATCTELRLIENTHREDLTYAEKGDAIYALMGNYPEKYPTIVSVAEAINTPYGTVVSWTQQSRKLSDTVRRYLENSIIKDDQAASLLPFSHEIQNQLVKAIVEKELNILQTRKFISLYKQNPSKPLEKLIDEALGIKPLRIDVSELSEVAREEIDRITKEKEKEAEESRREARKKAQEARKARNQMPKMSREELEVAARFASEELKEEEVREALEKHLTKMKESTMKVPKEEEVITSRLEEIEIPFATKSRLEKSIEEPGRQVAVAEAMIENKLDEWGRGRLIELAKNAPWASVEDLVKMVKDENMKGTFLVLEIGPKMRNVLYMEMEKRGEERMKDVVRSLLNEKLEELGYIPR